MDAVFFLTIYDDWGKRKLHYFKSLGLSVHVLWEAPPEEKGINSNDIRHRILSGRPWKSMVPACVPPMIETWDIAGRLKQLYDDC
jgi:nicotinamide-nucleotide adenylyltransferase